ncbi:MAG: DUF3570 domain-containing protein [Limnohabitans sp.]
MAVIKQNAKLPDLGAALLGAAMALPCIMLSAQAETAPEKGTLSFKYLNYKERQQVTGNAGQSVAWTDSQSGASAYDDRVRVKATATSVLLPLNGQWSLSGTLVTDSISGASPAYHTQSLSKLQDFRRAVDTSLTRYLPNGKLALGLSHSGENDYIYRAVSLLATQASEDKNTTWTAGVAIQRDVINPANQIVANEKKRGSDWLLGVTQVVSMNDVVQLNVGHYSGRGYFSDPYKIYDERPTDRAHQTFQARWNHHVSAFNGTSRLAYRFYTDTWGIRSHTLDAEWVQRLGSEWRVAPQLRLYSQNAARFYVEVDPRIAPFPPSPSPNALHFSEDQRLSAFGAVTMGLKVTRQLSVDTAVDVKIEQYGQKAAWKFTGVGSQGLAPFYARSIQVGITHSF